MKRAGNESARVIAFEGIDGSGKGVQVRSIEHKLKEAGNKVLVLDFPRYDSFFGKEVGKLLSGEYEVRADNLDPKSMCLWFALDRMKASQGLLREEYDYILLNRSTLSSVIYQSIRVEEEQKKEFIQWVFELEYQQLGVIEPELYLVFDVSQKISKKNVAGKEQRDYLSAKYDVYEKSEGLMDRARNQYLAMAEEYKQIEIINCLDQGGSMKSIDAISDMVLTRIGQR